MFDTMRTECEFCYDEENKRYFECDNCGFCRKFYHNGTRIIKRRNICDEREINIYDGNNTEIQKHC